MTSSTPPSTPSESRRSGFGGWPTSRPIRSPVRGCPGSTFLARIPASIENLTVSYNVRAIAQVPSIAEGDAATGAMWLAVIAVGWLGIGLWQIRRLEA